MPEQLTKHPDVTLEVLRSATGVQCGAGAKQEILTACPPQRFCKLPGGEMCVYGLPEARSMTQITAADWKAIAQVPAAVPSAPARTSDGGNTPMVLGGGLVAGIVIGAVASLMFRRSG